MTPEQVLGKSTTEHSHQAAFFCWLNQNKHLHQGIDFALASANGGKRDMIEAARMRTTGVKRGVPDIFIPIPCGQQHGLWIEFKKPSLEKSMKGTVTDKDQIRYRDYLISANYSHFVAFHYLQAIEATINYLSQK